MLKRKKRTLFQFDLASSVRGSNVKDAFVLSNNIYNNYHDKHILLIDDSMTTGSTIREAAKELLKIKTQKNYGCSYLSCNIKKEPDILALFYVMI